MIEFNIYVLAMVCASIFTGISQLLLKISANKKHKSITKEYMNINVFLSYVLLGFSLLFNMFGFRGVPFKFISVFAGLNYLIALILSIVVLHEKVTLKKIIGNMIILLGVIICGFK